MPSHQEEEIEGASNSISDAPFVTAVRKSGRSRQLPLRYQAQKSLDPPIRKKRSSQNLKTPKIDVEEVKNSSFEQSDILSFSTFSPDNENTRRQGQKRVEPKWMENYRNAKSKDERFATISTNTNLNAHLQRAKQDQEAKDELASEEEEEEEEEEVEGED
jgi:hypothetical protein